MKKKHLKMYVRALIVFVFLMNCANHEIISPDQNESQNVSSSDVLQKIKALGFKDETIREMDDYYLVDGDIYFPKKAIEKTVEPTTEKKRILGKYPVFTIQIDASVANDQDWIEAIEEAIKTWNDDKQKHFHFALTNSSDADIVLLKDNSLPQDVSVATHFPIDGRIGAAIRINAAYNKSDNARTNESQLLLHSLKRCAGTKHDAPEISGLKEKNNLSVNARTASNTLFVAIQGDWLWRRYSASGVASKIGDTWSESSAMEYSSYIYIIQFGVLYSVNWNNVYTPLTNNWWGALSITYMNGKLYVLQASALWEVDRNTGEATPVRRDLPTAVQVVGFRDQRDGNYKFGILLVEDGKAIVRIFSNQFVSLRTITIPHSKYTKSGTNSFNGMTEAGGFLWVYHQGLFYKVQTNAIVERISQAKPRLKLSAITRSSGTTIWIVDDGNLYKIMPMADPFTEEMLDRKGDWEGVSLTTTATFQG